MRYFCLLLTLIFSPITIAKSDVQVLTELSPPHQTLINGRIGGKRTEFVRAILREADLAGDFYMYPWARAYKMALIEPNTLIYAMARTDDREDLFHWLGKIATFDIGFIKLSTREDIEINSLEDGKRYSVAAQRGDVAANWLIKEGYDVVLMASNQECWHLLLSGKVDLITDDVINVQSTLAKFGYPESAAQYVYSISPLATSGYLAANINTDKAIVRRLQDAYNKVKRLDKFQKLITPMRPE